MQLHPFLFTLRLQRIYERKIKIVIFDLVDNIIKYKFDDDDSTFYIIYENEQILEMIKDLSSYFTSKTRESNNE